MANQFQQRLELQKYLLSSGTLDTILKMLNIKKENAGKAALVEMVYTDVLGEIDHKISDRKITLEDQQDFLAISQVIINKTIADITGHSIWLNESSDMGKNEIKNMIKDEMDKLVSKLEKNFMTKKDVKEMIKSTIVNQYKYLWEKSAFFINNI